MQIITTVTPLADELADANWIEYMVVRVEQNAANTAKQIVENVIANRVVYTENEESEQAAQMLYMQNTRAAIEDASVVVLSIDFAQGISWPHIAHADY